MSSVNAISFFSKTIVQCKRLGTRFNEKTKGTFIESLTTYWRSVVRDYKDVFVSLKQDARDKPLKAAVVLTGMALVAVSAKTNPNAQSFRAKCIESTINLSLIHPNSVVPSAVQHLKYIEGCYNADLVRHKSFGIFSLVWVDTHSDKCNTYQSNCGYLHWQYRHFNKQFLDFGFWNIWWVTSRKMLDYDVNY